MEEVKLREAIGVMGMRRERAMAERRRYMMRAPGGFTSCDDRRFEMLAWRERTLGWYWVGHCRDAECLTRGTDTVERLNAKSLVCYYDDPK